MASFQNNNPYAPPEPVDASDYDLRKIARLYNRLGTVLKWFVPLLVIDMIIMMSFVIIFWLIETTFSESPAVADTSRLVGIVLILPVHLPMCLLFIYGVFTVERIALAMKYRGLVMLLIVLGAISNGINIYVMILMRRKAKSILNDCGIEIFNGKIDLTQITVEEDY